MAKGDISVVGPAGVSITPANLRASGGLADFPGTVDVPSEAGDPNATWLDTLQQRLMPPPTPEDYGDTPLTRLYNDYIRQINPFTALIGEGKRLTTDVITAPLNAARFAARFSPDPNAEQYLSGEDPTSAVGQFEALSGPTGPLGLKNAGEKFGGAVGDIGAMLAADAALPEAGATGATNWALQNVGKGALYGQLLDNDAETGAVYGGIGGAAIDATAPVLKRLAPFLESAAEKSLGRVIAPGKEAWKKFVGKNAQEIIRAVPPSAAAPWREGGGLQGIVDFAQEQANAIGTSLDAAYKARLQPDIAPKLKSIRDRIRATADGLLTAHGKAVINLAPESTQALQDIRASLATGRGGLNPSDTNISALQDAASRLQDVVSGLGAEIQRTGQASPRAFPGQLIQRAIGGGAQSTAEQGITQAMSEIGDVINTDLVGTRMATGPLARRIDALRMNFGDLNAAGDFVSSDPAFTANIAKLADTVRSYGPEMNAQQLRGLAQDWGEIVAGARGTGFLSPMADESMKGALRAARGEVKATRNALMGKDVADQSNELAFWKRLSDAAASTAERRVGHVGGGLFGSMATLAGFGGGAGYAAHAMGGAGVLGTLGAGAVAAPAAAVTVRVMRSPLYNLMSAKTKLAFADALRKGTVPGMATVMRRALLELSLLDHGGLAALGHQDLTNTEAEAEHFNITQGRGPTPGVLDAPAPDAVYGHDGSVDDDLRFNQRLLQQQDQIDSTLDEGQPLDPQTESRAYDTLANTPVATAGVGNLPQWLQTPLLNAPDLGPAHPHLQKMANLIADQTSPLNAAFLGEEALRPLAAATRLARPVEMIGKGLAAAMAAAGLQTGLEGVQEGRPGKIISGGVQTGLGALGLRGGGLARAGEEAGAAVGAGAEALGSFGSRLGRGLAGAGKQALIGPAIGLSSQALADTDLAKSLIPDDETRHAVFEAAGVGAGVGGLAMAAGRGMKGLEEAGSIKPREVRFGVSKASTAKAIYNRLVDPESFGITIDLKNGQEPSTGSMVSVYSNAPSDRVVTVPLADFTQQHVVDFVQANRDVLSKKGRYFGGWRTDIDGVPSVVLDSSRRYKADTVAEKAGNVPGRAAQSAAIAKQVRQATVRGEAGEGFDRYAPLGDPLRDPAPQKAIYTLDPVKGAAVGEAPVGQWREFMDKPMPEPTTAAMWKSFRDEIPASVADKARIAETPPSPSMTLFDMRTALMEEIGQQYIEKHGTGDWYRLYGTDIEKAYNPDGTNPDAIKKFAGYLAASSPTTNLSDNLRAASEYMRRDLAGEPVLQPDFGSSPYAQTAVSKKFRGKAVPMERGYAPNLQRVSRGEEISGTKVGPMMRAMLGHPDSAALDTHWAKIAEDPQSGVYTGPTFGVVPDPAKDVIHGRLADLAAARGIDKNNYAARAWTGIRQMLSKTGSLFGTKYGKRSAGEHYGFADYFAKYVPEKAAHLGISVEELMARLGRGEANLLSAMLATSPVLYQAFTRWQQNDQTPAERRRGGARPDAASSAASS